jgi:hypothetical protein
MLNKYPIHQGEIEIKVPAHVTGNMLVTPLGSDSPEIVPVRNGVISVTEAMAAHFLGGNNGKPLPGYEKSVVDADQGGKNTGGGSTALPTVDEIKNYLTEKKVKFHPSTGEAKLQALYAVELKNEQTSDPVPVTAENYGTATIEGLAVALPGIEDAEFLKTLIALEANGQARDEFLAALEGRLTELAK